METKPLRKILMQNRRKLSILLEWAIACMFLDEVLGNILFFYLSGGATWQAARFIVHWGVIGGVLLCTCGAFVLCRKPVHQKLVASCWFAFVVVIYVAGLVVHPAHVPQIVKDGLVFLLTCSSFTAAAALLYWRVVSLDRVAEKAIWAGVLLQPFFLLADVTFWLRDTTEVNNLGTIGYLEMSYTALALLAVVVYYFGWGKVYDGRAAPVTKILALVEGAIAGATIVILGSRGALLALIVFGVAALTIAFALKARLALFGLAAVVALAAGLSFVGMPETSVTKLRYEVAIESLPLGPEEEPPPTKDFTEELPDEEQELPAIDGPTKWLCEKTGINDELISIFYVYSEDNGGMKALALEMRNEVRGGEGYGEVLDEAVLDVTNRSAGRWYHWMLALYELQQHHGWGSAPYTYHVKYNAYAHNIWIEAFVEYGVLGGTLFLLLTLLVLVRAIQEARKDGKNSYFLLFLAMAFTRLFISGNLYGDRWLCFLMATGALSLYSLYKEKHPSCKKQEVLA